MCNARDIDSAAAGVVTDAGTADFLGRTNFVGSGGDVQRRIHRERDDRRSARRCGRVKTLQYHEESWVQARDRLARAGLDVTAGDYKQLTG